MRSHSLTAVWLGGQEGSKETNMEAIRIIQARNNGAWTMRCQWRGWQMIRACVSGKVEVFPDIIWGMWERETSKDSKFRRKLPVTEMEMLGSTFYGGRSEVQFWTHQIWDTSKTPKWIFQVRVSSRRKNRAWYKNLGVFSFKMLAITMKQGVNEDNLIHSKSWKRFIFLIEFLLWHRTLPVFPHLPDL